MRRQPGYDPVPQAITSKCRQANVRPITPVRTSTHVALAPGSCANRSSITVASKLSAARRFSPATRRGGSPLTSPSCRSCCSANLETHHRSTTWLALPTTLCPHYAAPRNHLPALPAHRLRQRRTLARDPALFRLRLRPHGAPRQSRDPLAKSCRYQHGRQSAKEAAGAAQEDPGAT